MKPSVVMGFSWCSPHTERRCSKARGGGGQDPGGYGGEVKVR